MRKSNKIVKRISVLSLATALALILSYIESLLPPIFPAIPGIKIGLANTVAMILLYEFSYFDAIAVSGLRVLISSLLFGNFTAFIYSMSGAVLSLTVMALLKKTGLFSKVGTSISGGVFHNIGQILCAVFMLNTREILYYLPVLLVTGTISGAFIGFAAKFVLSKLENTFFKDLK